MVSSWNNGTRFLPSPSANENLESKSCNSRWPYRPTVRKNLSDFLLAARRYWACPSFNQA